MKNWMLLLSAILLGITQVKAQDETDALRYSRTTSGGDARTIAIGGAAGSLGGDASDIWVNPAGIGFFKTNDLSFTPLLHSINTDAQYYQTSASDSKSQLALQNLALILASNSKRSSHWKNITFGVGENRIANFNQALYYQGKINTPASTYSSYSDNYLITLAKDQVQDVQTAETNYPFGISESVRAGLIGPVYDNNNQFAGWSSLPSQIIADGYALLQSKTLLTRGGLDVFSLAAAGNYEDKFFIGAALNIPSISFERHETFEESNPGDANSPLNKYDVLNYLKTTGVGISGSLGIIYAPVSALRLGISVQTPSYYSMHDSYYTTVTTNTKDQGVVSATTADVTGGYTGDYAYNLTTPMHLVGSASYVFGASNPDPERLKGFITADYEWVDYRKAHFRYDQSYSSDIAQQNKVNQSISQLYQGASNIRLGGELKWDIWAVRAGFAYYGNPYASASGNVNAAQYSYSGGLGYRNKGFYLDFTYVFSSWKDQNQPYYVIQPNSLQVPSPAPATWKARQSQFVLTLGFKI